MLSVNYGNANFAQTDLELNQEFLAFTALDIRDTAYVCPVRMIFFLLQYYLILNPITHLKKMFLACLLLQLYLMRETTLKL